MPGSGDPAAWPLLSTPADLDAPAPRRNQPGLSLSALLVLAVAVVVALGSLRASGAGRPKPRSTQPAGITSGHAPQISLDAALLAPAAVPTAEPTQATATVAAPKVAIAQPTMPAPPRAAPQPNELGQVLILEYHVFTTDPAQEGQWVRTISDFRADLEWLYEHDFAIVPLRDVYLNQIAAPRGKHPVVLTFDDGTAGQFRFLPQPDGTLRVDPNSAVGVMEAMFAAHPDFGRGGHFAVLPFNCFHVPDEPDQTPYCQAKLRWLDAHGYGVGNHTTGHTDLRDVDDATFKSTIADAITWADAAAPHASADILTMPFGNYPDAEKHPEQVRWLHDGFTYEGKPVHLLGTLMVGGGLAPSPVSVVWNPYKVPRIQASDDVLAYWRHYCEENEDLLYTSDGDPTTITVPRHPPPQLQGAFDASRAAGRRIVMN
jgi:peptidoglycan/xylan/chitin deacetylase (PgdA/CDA1 family)